MEKKDLEYILSTLEYALNKCTCPKGEQEHSYNLFANAINVIKDELNFNIKTKEQ